MIFPPRITPDRVLFAMATAEQAEGLVLVSAYDVPDHWTRAALIPWRGRAALNRIGLAERERLLAECGGPR